MADLPSHVNPGIFKYSLIRMINSRTMNLSHNLGPVPMSDVLHFDNSEHHSSNYVVKDIMQEMALFDYHGIFGLTFNDILDMPFDQWRLLRSTMRQIRDAKENKGDE